MHDNNKCCLQCLVHVCWIYVFLSSTKKNGLGVMGVACFDINNVCAMYDRFLIFLVWGMGMSCEIRPRDDSACIRLTPFHYLLPRLCGNQVTETPTSQIRLFHSMHKEQNLCIEFKMCYFVYSCYLG